MTQEIFIHKSLNHKNIVGFHGFFDDSHNIYIILELCRKRVRHQNSISFNRLNNWQLRKKIYINEH